MAKPEHERTVVVVGFGPAGLSASKALLEQGVSVVVLDENTGPGGQYYKQYTAAPDLPRGSELDELHRTGLEKAAALSGANFSVRYNALVWGLYPGNQMAIYVDGQVEILTPDAILLATGAIERVAAFPGWTLPGVMTAGGAQMLLSREAILSGKRFLLAGTGPLLLAIALEIAEAGGEVAAVIEGSRLTSPLRHARSLLRQSSRIRQAGQYHLALRKHGVPVINGQTVIAARGDGHVEEVEVARIDGDWNVIPDSQRTYAVDTLCLHYGFTTSTELARQADCAIDYDEQRGGWFVRHDDGMRSSQPGIYVAGQIAGIGGADLGEATGRLAGLSVALDFGLMDQQSYNRAAESAREERGSGRDFARMLNTVYAPGAALAELVTPETIVCRCEEVRASEVDAALKRGAITLNDVKRQTRCGMGYCQGRICSQVLTPYLQQKAGINPEDAGQFNSRAPVKPVPLGALAKMPDPDLVPGD